MGQKFSKENQPENRGRKPSLYTIAHNAYGVSLEEYKKVEKFLLGLPREEVRKLSEKDDTPMWVVIYCRALYKDAGKGKTATLQEMENRLFGRPLQKAELSSGEKPFELRVVKTTEAMQDKINDYLNGSGLDGQGVQ